jgi:hypothetical protein
VACFGKRWTEKLAPQGTAVGVTRHAVCPIAEDRYLLLIWVSGTAVTMFVSPAAWAVEACPRRMRDPWEWANVLAPALSCMQAAYLASRHPDL